MAIIITCQAPRAYYRRANYVSQQKSRVKKYSEMGEGDLTIIGPRHGGRKSPNPPSRATIKTMIHNAYYQ